MTPTEAVLQDVLTERRRQDARWGEQNHPSGADASNIGVLCEIRFAVATAEETGTLTWMDIASEEFWEAFSEADPTKRRVELVQLAAVICAAIESEDRRAVKVSVGKEQP